MPQSYPPELKAKVVNARLGGASNTEVAAEYAKFGVTRQLVYSWTKAHDEGRLDITPAVAEPEAEPVGLHLVDNDIADGGHQDTAPTSDDYTTKRRASEQARAELDEAMATQAAAEERTRNAVIGLHNALLAEADSLR